jgi:hypothetical protein
MSSIEAMCVCSHELRLEIDFTVYFARLGTKGSLKIPLLDEALKVSARKCLYYSL